MSNVGVTAEPIIGVRALWKKRKRRLLLLPIPPVQFHLWWRGYPASGPLGWLWDTYSLPDGTVVNWPSVQQRRWKPSYWLLWYRVFMHGEVMLNACEPATGLQCVVTFDDQPEFTSAVQMLDYLNAKNARCPKCDSHENDSTDGES